MFVVGGTVTATRAEGATEGDGVAAWVCSASRYSNVGGSVHLVVTAADLNSDGRVQVRLLGKVSSGTKTLFAATPSLNWWARNHGRGSNV
jgi:hypothetical protein